MPLAQALVHPAGPPPANPAACRHGHRAPTAQRSRLAHSAALLSHLLLAGLPCPRLQRLASSSFDLCMRRAKLGCCRTTALQAARRRRCQSSGLRRVSDAIAGAVAAAAAATGAARVAASFAGGRGGGGAAAMQRTGVCVQHIHTCQPTQLAPCLPMLPSCRGHARRGRRRIPSAARGRLCALCHDAAAARALGR